jgi:hypothetical protein
VIKKCAYVPVQHINGATCGNCYQIKTVGTALKVYLNLH